jgi:dethiobiotin synthetase/adenosylmethionine--8-amino-7-oxononanoate aminotransferase
MPQIKTATNDNLAWQGLPIVFDEVFTGLYRLGRFSPSSLLNVYPDISVHAKLLTGGLVPLCTTLASDSIYDAFLSSEKSEALLHGHSYTAHAVGCEVARASLQAMLDMDKGEDWETFKSDWADQAQSTNVWSVWSKDFVSQISRARDVESVVAIGSVLAISLHDGQNKGYTSTAASGLQKNLLKIGREAEGSFGIHSRVLGNVLYLMASQTSKVTTLRAIEARLISALRMD